ncbi:S8 family peptidase [Adhaeribacter pallidiroseus]|uniref:Aqualysin-1 n=1 Tax=Adhaeribacter pallidiroseus TaxID=2072847 RepID=A0A369QNI3_9BACT|nr:S8 family serine peptidase [Adhaeribacter pallidiroseus]RDC63778.1 Aqualysin-1 [Adhaeribacter pallidiroseus]
MKEKHIILRLARAASRDLFLGSGMATTSATESLAAGLTVEIEEIDRNRISALSRHSDVIAIAPSIPMKLIEPVAVQDLDESTSSEVAWGVRAVGADTSPFTGSGIVVAVLDTGIDAAHPAFAGVSIIQNDFTGEGSGDQHGHGTHCAGTIFGRTSDNVRIGVAPGVEKALIGKVLGSQGGSSEQIVSAMQWAVDNGANVISMSLGMDFPGLVKRLQDNGFPTELATSRALEGYRTNVQLFERLVALINAKANFLQTTLVVAAAGNESLRDTNPDFEIAVSPPAVAEGIVSVAALGEDPDGLVVANFSNTGATVSGPGVNIMSAKMGGGFALMSGTSMATPHVAGVAALWAEKIKTTGILSPAQLAARLIGSGTSLGLKTGFDPFDIGSGLVRAPQM